MNELERNLIRSSSVPTIPRVAQKLLELLNREHVNLSEIADVISVEPSLAVKVIRLINSPFYSLAREITSLRDGVLYLGLNPVRSVALSFSFLSAFHHDGSRGERLDALWSMSLMNALAARRLANEVGGWDGEEAFLTGLVADAGVLLMYASLPEYSHLLDKFYQGEADLLELEQEHLRTTHPRLGSLLLETWKFPKQLVELVGYHHEPTLVPSESPSEQRARILYAAWQCARALTVPGFTDKIASLEHRVSGLLGIPVVVARGIVADLPDELREMASLFEIPAEAQRSYQDLLEEANQTLSRIALKADQNARELAGALGMGRSNGFRDVPQPALEPEDVDPETGLLSHPAFERSLEAFHRRARENHRPIGLIIMEIANLKSIVEHNGPDAAREALARIGARALQLIRQSDQCARLSENQIAVLAPGCSAPNLMHAAERIRFGLENEPLETSAGPLSCQVVVGLATTTPHKDAIDPHTLVRFAASAVDRAQLTPDRLVSAGWDSRDTDG